MYTVAGVLPPEFRLPATWGGTSERNPEVWVPFEIDPARRDEEMNRNSNSVFARLKDGATVERAREELKAIALRLARERSRRNTGWSATAVTLREEEAGPDLRRGLLMLQVAVGFVLLIACANLANLLLARMAGRQREIAVRAALGAGRVRLVRQLLSESLLLALLGGVAGLGVALLAIRAVAAAAPSDLERLAQLRINWRVFGFTMAAALASGFVFGLAPALHGVRASLFGALRGGTGRHAGRRALLAAQVALAMVLLAGAGLMMRSLAAVLANRPGFRGDVLTLRVNLPPEKYPKTDDLKLFCRQLLERLERLPGVTSAALTNGLPMQSINMFGFHLDGKPLPPGGMLFADYRSVTPGYFGTLGIPLLRGRLFTPHEPEKNTPVIVNEAFARRFWPGENPIGKTLTMDRGPSGGRREVVGLVADTRQFKLESAPRAEVFFPMRGDGEITVAVRTAGPPMALAESVKAAVWAIDKDQPVIKVGVLDRWIRDSVSMRKFHVLVLGIFACYRPGAGSRRHLRPAGLVGQLPDARNRGAHGARRAAGAGAAVHHARRFVAGGGRHGGRGRGGHSPHAPVARPALRDHARRPRHLRRRLRYAGSSGACGGLAAGSPRHPYRPLRGAQARVEMRWPGGIAQPGRRHPDVVALTRHRLLAGRRAATGPACIGLGWHTGICSLSLTTISGN